MVQNKVYDSLKFTDVLDRLIFSCSSYRADNLLLNCFFSFDQIIKLTLYCTFSYNFNFLCRTLMHYYIVQTDCLVMNVSYIA